MDNDTLDLLKTVCVAGRATFGFNDNSNDRLEKLVEEGLLDAVRAAGAGPKSTITRLYYRPTEQGRALLRTLSEKGAA